MSGADLDLVVRARRAVVHGAVRPCSVGVRAGRIVAVAAYEAALAADEVTDLAADEVLLPGLVDVGFWGGAIPGNAAELRRLHEAGSFGFKCFLLPSGVDEFPPLDEAGLELAMREIAAFGGLLIVHAEDAREIGETPPGPGYAGFLRSRPPAAEQRAIEILLETAQRTGARVHVLHLSSAAALPAIGAARARGVRVSVETCPHYLSFAAEEMVVEWMSARPAALCGLARKGALAVGRDADMCVFAPEDSFVVDAAALRHRNPVSAYDGKRLTGTVRRTWLGGRPVAGDGHSEPAGRLLRRTEW